MFESVRMPVYLLRWPACLCVCMLINYTYVDITGYRCVNMVPVQTCYITQAPVANGVVERLTCLNSAYHEPSN